MSDEKVTSQTLREWAAWLSGGKRPGWADLKTVAKFLIACADSSDSLDRMEAEQDAEQERRAARLKLEGEQT